MIFMTEAKYNSLKVQGKRMTGFIFTTPTTYCVKFESRCYILASDYNKENIKANDLVRSMRFQEKFNSHQLYSSCLYIQIWSKICTNLAFKLNANAVTKYVTEIMKASFAIKNMQNYSVNNFSNFYPSKLFTKRNAASISLKVT